MAGPKPHLKKAHKFKNIIPMKKLDLRDFQHIALSFPLPGALNP
jgi:hypothetical protein